MDIVKVRALTDTELLIELGTQRHQLYDLRFQLATRQLTDHTQLTQTRRTIARVLTVMTERGLEGAPVPTQPVTGRAATRARSRAKAATADKAKTAPGTSAEKTETATSGRGGKR